MDFPIFIFLLISALVIGSGKGGLGSAFAGILVPIAGIFMPVSEAIAYTLPLFIIGDWFALRVYWGKWDWEEFKRIIPLAVVTVLMGTYLLATLPNDVIRVILGIMALTISIYKLVEKRLTHMQYSYRPYHSLIAGGLTGLGSGLANAGGPILTAFLLLIRMQPVPYIATTALFFAIMNMLRVPALIATDVLEVDKLLMVIWFAPVVGLGNYIGKRMIDHINPRMFEMWMIVTLFIAGLILIFR